MTPFVLLSLAFVGDARAADVDPDDFPVEASDVVEAPLVEAPAVEPLAPVEPAAAVGAAVAVEAPPVEVPAVAAPAVAAPAVEAPTWEPSAIAAPTLAAPAVAAPAVAAPAVEAPAVAASVEPPLALEIEAEPPKGFFPWVGRAAVSVGAGLGTAWVAVTGKKKGDRDDAVAVVDPDDLNEVEAVHDDVDVDVHVEIVTPAPAPVVEPESAEVEPEPDCEEDPADRWRFHQHTLFGMKRRSGRFGLHIGGTYLLSEYGNGGAGAWGLEGGMVLGSHFVLGAAAYATSFESSGHDALFTYGGFQPGLILWSGAFIHPRFDVLIGTGALLDADSGRLIGMAPVVVPRLGAELNVSRALRLSGNLGYRFVDAPGAAQDRFSGFEAGVTLRFGWM